MSDLKSGVFDWRLYHKVQDDSCLLEIIAKSCEAELITNRTNNDCWVRPREDRPAGGHREVRPAPDVHGPPQRLVRQHLQDVGSRGEHVPPHPEGADGQSKL